MSIVEFRYIAHRGRKVPIIPVRVEGKDGWYEVWAFVDSEATYSIFEEKDAEMLGIKPAIEKKIMVMVGDGSFIPVYLYRLRLKIGEFSMDAEIGFSGHLGTGFNILGRRNIFEIFQVCFNDKKEIVSFQRIKER